MNEFTIKERYMKNKRKRKFNNKRRKGIVFIPLTFLRLIMEFESNKLKKLLYMGD